GVDVTPVAERNLNDLKGPDAPALDAWTTAAALAAVTERLELMVAVRPTFHPPALAAKQAANIDHISRGRLTLNVVSSWWAEEARQYGVEFDRHDARYARTAEWLAVVSGMWAEPRFSFAGTYYRVQDAILEPKPVSQPRPTIYAGGESEAAKGLIAGACDAYLMHGDPPERIATKVADLRARREWSCCCCSSVRSMRRWSGSRRRSSRSCAGRPGRPLSARRRGATCTLASPAVSFRSSRSKRPTRSRKRGPVMARAIMLALLGA